MTFLWPDQNFDTIFMTWYPISYQNGGKMAKLDTLFMTKSAGATNTFIAYIKEYPPALPPWKWLRPPPPHHWWMVTGEFNAGGNPTVKSR